MSGEMLEDSGISAIQNPQHPTGRFFLPGPLCYYLLLTALFNVFPLPRRRDFQPSFAHAGRAMDRGYNVMVFPEGDALGGGQAGTFRPGIGLLVKQCGAAVLPVAIRGLGELKTREKRWFRSGKIEVRVGEPIRFVAGGERGGDYGAAAGRGGAADASRRLSVHCRAPGDSSGWASSYPTHAIEKIAWMGHGNLFEVRRSWMGSSLGGTRLGESS